MSGFACARRRVVLTLLCVLVVAATPSLAAGDRAEAAVSARGCVAGVVSKDVRTASARVDRRRVEMVRVSRVRGRFEADARVRVTGTTSATVRVTVDACPSGSSNPKAATRSVALADGGWAATVRDRTAGSKAVAKRQAVSSAKAKAKSRMRKFAVRSATKAARAAAWSASSAGTTTPTSTPTTTPTSTPTTTPTSTPSEAELEAFRVKVRAAVIRYTNIERAKVGAGPLTSLAPVTGGAQRWAQQMTINGVVGHEGAAGTLNNPGVENCTQQTSITEISTGFSYTSEFSDAAADRAGQSAVASWVGSSGHYAQLVKSNYSRTGIGVGLVPAGAAGYWKLGTVQRPWAGSCPQYAS